MRQALCNLPVQGGMARSWGESYQDDWIKVVRGLPPESFKFALNAAQENLPTNAILHKWGKKSSDVCRLCGVSRQTLCHILNCCPTAMDLRRYSARHDQVLLLFGNFVRTCLPSDYSVTVDLPSSQYDFPHHIIPTDLRPDIVWWSDQRRAVAVRTDDQL